jgi:hypothetical protein
LQCDGFSVKQSQPSQPSHLEPVKEDLFWHRFKDLEQESSDHTVKGEELRHSLVSSGKFYQSDAAILIDNKLRVGDIEAVSGLYDVYCRGGQ